MRLVGVRRRVCLFSKSSFVLKLLRGFVDDGSVSLGFLLRVFADDPVTKKNLLKIRCHLKTTL